MNEMVLSFSELLQSTKKQKIRTHANYVTLFHVPDPTVIECILFLSSSIFLRQINLFLRLTDSCVRDFLCVFKSEFILIEKNEMLKFKEEQKFHIRLRNSGVSQVPHEKSTSFNYSVVYG